LHLDAPEEPVNISGIVVTLEPGSVQRALAALGALPGVEVHHVDPTLRRAVVTQETGSTEEQEEGLRSLEAVPGVINALLVYHWFENAEA
jgi:nitrate reductase NapD